MLSAVPLLNPDEFYAMATQNGEEEAEKFYRNAKREKEQLEKRIQDLDNIIRCLYEDRVSGRITPERYDSMANVYEQEQAEKKRELQELAERISEVDMRDKCIQEFIRNAKQYIEITKLTPELLRVFIRRIEVYEKFEKYSRTAGNPSAYTTPSAFPNRRASLPSKSSHKPQQKLHKSNNRKVFTPSGYIPPTNSPLRTSQQTQVLFSFYYGLKRCRFVLTLCKLFFCLYSTISFFYQSSKKLHHKSHLTPDGMASKHHTISLVLQNFLSNF